CLVGRSLSWQTDATADGGEEHASVKLDRPLPEALPIDHPRVVTQVENVAGVECAMDKARGDLLGLGPFQQADERCGSGSQRPISGTQSCGPFAAPMEHARRAERRAKSHGQGPSALEPMCGQLPRTRPLPITEKFLGSRPLQPADG